MPGLHIRLTDTDACELTKFATKNYSDIKVSPHNFGSDYCRQKQKISGRKENRAYHRATDKKGLLHMIGAYFDS